jgi:hypothetical protein
MLGPLPLAGEKGICLPSAFQIMHAWWKGLNAEPCWPPLQWPGGWWTGSCPALTCLSGLFQGPGRPQQSVCMTMW